MRFNNFTLVPLPLLPKEEQQAIAAFLDRETSRIDALVQEQQRLMDLLKEKRQAVISHAVTRGLDSSAVLKDSGFGWMGKVPAHWNIQKFGSAVGYQEGPGIMAEDFHEEGVPLLRVAGVQGRWATLEGCNFLDPEKVAAKWAHFRLEEGDLVISASATMGTVSEVSPEVAGAVPYTGLIRLKPKSGLSKDYIRLLVSSHLFFAQIDRLKAGATIQHFGPAHLRQMMLVLPPLQEQGAITCFVERQVASLDSMLAEAASANAMLQERRSALIAAAVTGKIDVRNLAPARAEAA
jgi:type I restriction enzyme, S subunit